MTINEYLDALPEDRRAELEKVRKVFKKNMPKGIEEGFCYGAIGYFVPHKIYPPGYHTDPQMPLPFGLLAVRKNFLTLSINSIYYDDGSRQWFEKAFADAGKKLDMGVSCIHFKKADDLPLDVIADAVSRMSIDDFVKRYEAAIPESKRKKSKR